MNAHTSAERAPLITPTVLTMSDVLAYISANPGADCAMIAAATGRKASNVRRDAPRWVAEGLLADALGGFWTVTPYGESTLRALARAQAEDVSVGAVDCYFGELTPNPANPRIKFNERELAELADSIAAVGVLQRLLVSAPDASGARMIWAGERRWRAVKLLILTDRWPAIRRIPCQQSDEPPNDLAPIYGAYVGVIENSQRVDLSKVEQARGWSDLMTQTGWSARELARRIGKDPRVVQEDVKVFREASPAALAAYERGEQDKHGELLTWERLRYSVRESAPKANDPSDGAASTLVIPAEALRASEPSPHFGRPSHGSQIDDQVDAKRVDAAIADAMSKPTQAVDDWTPRQRLAMVELLYKIISSVRDGNAAPTYQHWKSRDAHALQSGGMVTFAPDQETREWRCALTSAGNHWLEVNFNGVYTVTFQDLEAYREFCGEALWPQDIYVTPWLRDPPYSAEREDAAPDRPEAYPDSLDNDALNDAQADADALTLSDVRALTETLTLHRLVANPNIRRDIAALLNRLGVYGSMRAAGGDNAGAINDANLEEIATVDVNRDNSDAHAEAIALLIASAINLITGSDDAFDEPISKGEAE